MLSSASVTGSIFFKDQFFLRSDTNTRPVGCPGTAYSPGVSHCQTRAPLLFHMLQSKEAPLLCGNREGSLSLHPHHKFLHSVKHVLCGHFNGCYVRVLPNPQKPVTYIFIYKGCFSLFIMYQLCVCMQIVNFLARQMSLS